MILTSAFGGVYFLPLRILLNLNMLSVYRGNENSKRNHFVNNSWDHHVSLGRRVIEPTNMIHSQTVHNDLIPLELKGSHILIIHAPWDILMPRDETKKMYNKNDRADRGRAWSGCSDRIYNDNRIDNKSSHVKPKSV